MAKRLGNIKLNEVAFFLCDMQERFRTAIKYFSEILEVSQRLVEGSKLLNIPLVVTEQYPKGLGSTVPELKIQHAVGVYDKTKFSMLVPPVESVLPQLCNGQLKHVVLFGIEILAMAVSIVFGTVTTHVCIQQTVIDLLERDYQVHVVADATSSRSQMDRLLALQRFVQAGAIVTSSEAVLLQLVGDKDHPSFKDIQALIKVSAPISGLVPMTSTHADGV